MILPITEPLDRPEGDTGKHWTLGIVEFERKAVYYLDSASEPSVSGGDVEGFQKFREVRKHFGKLLCVLLIVSVQAMKKYILGRALTEKVPEADDGWSFQHKTVREACFLPTNM